MPSGKNLHVLNIIPHAFEIGFNGLYNRKKGIIILWNSNQR